MLHRETPRIFSVSNSSRSNVDPHVHKAPITCIVYGPQNRHGSPISQKHLPWGGPQVHPQPPWVLLIECYEEMRNGGGLDRNGVGDGV